MLIKPVLTPSGKKLFTLRPAQVFLAALMLAVIGSLIAVSFAAVQSHDRTRETVLAEESDASALVFIQRESFGLIIEIEEHLLDQSPIEDVLLARSTLSQRLNVITSTGESSYSVAGPNYRLALEKLDELILTGEALGSGLELRLATDAFLTQTRSLTDVFQELSRENIQSAVATQAQVDILQGALSLLALGIGFILFFWFVRDLTSGFRVGYAELTEQSEAIKIAERDFLAIEMLDEKIAEWNQRVGSGGDLTEIVSEVKRELSSLSDGRVSEDSKGELQLDLGEGFDFKATETRRLLESRLRELIAQIQLQNLARQQLEWERDHCGLTGLLNRRGMGRELVQKLRDEAKEPFLLFDIDIDGFTSLNSAMGQDGGDQVLIELGKRLAALELAEFKAARIAADEFGLLVPLGTSTAEDILQKVEAATRYESELFPDDVAITSSIGWHVVLPGESADEAAAKTGAALKAAKAIGKTGVTQKFSETGQGHLLTEYLEQITFRNALLAGEIIPYLQPIVNLRTREIEGFEALARWKTPDRGILTPDKFMPIAIQGGLLDELLDVILEAVAVRWTDFTAEYPGAYVSVNVDPKTLQVTDFAERIIQEITRSKINPKQLVLEITEQSLVEDSKIAQLGTLRQLGVRISLDDFGTGYSSLSQISALPVDIIKVDRSFIADGVEDSAGEMLKTIRQMALGANLKVVVEGIETEEMAQALRDFGFESGQGYLFGKPEDLLNN